MTQKTLSLAITFLVVIGLFCFPAYAAAELISAANPFTDTNDTDIQKAAKHARYPEDGILFGYGDDGVAELQYNARYMFEQKKLPKTLFEYEKETVAYINTLNAGKMKKNILAMWELAAAEVIFNDAMLSGENPDRNNEDEIWALSDKRRPLFGLGDEHIVDVAIEKIDADTNAIIVELLDAKWVPLSTYISIAYNKTTGLKYFTLERSFDFMGDSNVPYMFCFVEDGSRGSYYTIQNDKQSFINAIKDVMSNSPAADIGSE